MALGRRPAERAAFNAPTPNSGSGQPRLWMLALLAGLAPAIFALSTNNIWEDFFITYRCSLNLAQGHGLVYEAGRTVHAFTSPLGTLLPAGISWLLHTDDPQRVIDVFRLCACLALAGAWQLAAGRMVGTVRPGGRASRGAAARTRNLAWEH